MKLRSLRRGVAKKRLKLMGVTHINKSAVFHDDWKDLSAPNYVEKLKEKSNKTKEERLNG